MFRKLEYLVTNKRCYYLVLTIVTIAVMLLLSDTVVFQNRDGRRQIIDEDGGEELMVSESLKSQEELRLQSMLSKIRGVGENQVMITWQEPEESVSVFSSTPQIKRIQGVIVAAEGASQPSVKLAIIDAITSVYGVPTSSVMVFSLEP